MRRNYLIQEGNSGVLLKSKDYAAAFNQLLDANFPTLEQMERWLIWAALCRTDFSQREAAKLLGVSERVMSFKMTEKIRPWCERLFERE